MQCLVAKPIVDGIEKDLQGRARVVRLNVSNELGREVAGTYGIRGVPAVVVLDRKGQVVHQHAGIPSRKTVVAKAAAA